MAYEEIETAYIWGVEFQVTRTQSQELEQFFNEQPEDLDLHIIRARQIWAERHGTEDRCAELAAEIHALVLRMYDKALTKARSLNSD